MPGSWSPHLSDPVTTDLWRGIIIFILQMQTLRLRELRKCHQDGASAGWSCVMARVTLVAEQACLTTAGPSTQALVSHPWDSPAGGSHLVGDSRPQAPSSLWNCCSLRPWSAGNPLGSPLNSRLFLFLEFSLFP